MTTTFYRISKDEYLYQYAPARFTLIFKRDNRKRTLKTMWAEVSVKYLLSLNKLYVSSLTKTQSNVYPWSEIE